MGEVIDDARDAAFDPRAPAHAARGVEPLLRSAHGFLLGMTTILLAVPALLAIIAVTVAPIIAWLLVAAVLRIAFRLIAVLAGARPDAVTTGAFLRAQVSQRMSRAWARAR